MSTRNYVFEEMSLTIGSQPIRDFGDGDSISITTPEDSWAILNGSHGSSIYSKKFAGASEATIRVMPGSPMNRFLWRLFNEDKRDGRGVRDFFLKDPRADETYCSAKCRIKKAPDVAYGQELSPREWVLTLTEVEMSEGANELA